MLIFTTIIFTIYSAIVFFETIINIHSIYTKENTYICLPLCCSINLIICSLLSGRLVTSSLRSNARHLVHFVNPLDCKNKHKASASFLMCYITTTKFYTQWSSGKKKYFYRKKAITSYLNLEEKGIQYQKLNTI